MQFAFRDAPEWFHDHILKCYIDELHSIQMAAKKGSKYNDEQFKRIAVEFFTNKGFTVWQNAAGQLWFAVDPDSAKWTFEILRT
jgi:hypothetical protein